MRRFLQASLPTWLLAGLLAAGAAHAAADIPRPRQLSVVDGLPGNVVNAVTEDRHGYLWVATSDGLARYDGTGFRVWQAEQGLPDNYLWAVDVDSRGGVWLGTGIAGLVRYDRDADAFVSFNAGNTAVIDSDQVWTVAVDREDSVWFGTSGAGLYRKDADGRIERFMPRAGDPRSLPSTTVIAIAVAPDGGVWVGTRAGVARWTGRDFERVPEDVLPDARVNSLYFDRQGVLWVGTAGGVAGLAADGSVTTPSWADDGGHRVLQVLLQDRRGDYWFDIPAGLGFAGQAAGEVRNVPLYSESSRGEVRPYWAGGYEDREGGIWLLSSSHALWYLPAGWNRLAVLARRMGDRGLLGNAHVLGIAPASRGGVWTVGTGGVLERLDTETGRVEPAKEDVGQGVILNSVLEDSRGMLWVGYSAGLARIDPGRGRVDRWDPDQAQDALPARTTIGRLAESGDGRLWLLGWSTHVQVRDGDGRVLHTFASGDGSGLEADEGVRDLAIGPDGRPWLGTSHGLRRLHAGGTRWEFVPGAERGLVAGIAPGEQMLWLAGVGTLDGYRWDGERLARLHRLDTRDGLPLVTFSGAGQDAAGRVWLTSNRGLIRVEPDERAVRVYGVRDGLPSQELHNPPVANPADDRILAGTPDGLVVFDAAADAARQEHPNLVIDQVGVRGQPPFVPDGPFAIRHSDRDLRVVARLLSFRNPSVHLYRFRLLGYEDDWVEAGAVGERVFSQLPPGDYALEIQARNAEGLWSQMRGLEFRVLPPWWRTLPAILAFAAGALLLLAWLAALYRARLRRHHAWQIAEHKRELAEQASLAKTRFLATLGHEVRTPMTGVLGMSELLLQTPLDERQRGYTESIRRAGDHLLRLVNDALDLARIEAGKLQLDRQPFDLRELLHEATGLVAPIARQRGLGFREAIAPAVPSWVLGDIVRVRQILLNLLGNAIKFTDQGHVALTAEPGGDDRIRFVVADTGPGLNAEQRERLFRRFEQADGQLTASRYGGSGLGLAICQELAAEMGGKISVDSAPGQGTRFAVELPLPAARAPARPPQEAAPRQSGALSLLLVEDDPTVAEVIAGLLRAQGHEVRHVAHGLAALTALADAVPDAALLDLDLPGLDGFALARQMRAQGFDRSMIAVTARADADVEPLATRAGFDAFLRKPLTGAMLARALAPVPRTGPPPGSTPG